MNIEAEIDKARSLHRQGKAAAAIPIYQAVLQEHPNHPEALHLLGVAALQSGDPKRAHVLLDRAAKLAPDNSKIQNNLGSVLLSLGQVSEAVDRLHEAIQHDPDFTDAYYNLGTALVSQQKIEEASDAYRNALRIDPTHAAANNNLGVIHRAHGDLLKALELHRNALDANPRSIEFRSNLVGVLEALNRVEEAEKEAEELLRTAPDFSIARLMRARLDRRAGQLEAARTGLQAALASSPHHTVTVPLYFEMARVLDGLGDYTGAFEAITRAKDTRRRFSDAPRWDLTSYPALVTRRREWFTAGRMTSIPDISGSPGDKPIFFVGFPRSGTTLMENCLAAHPKFVTTDERSPLDRVFFESESDLGRGIDLPDDLVALTGDEINLIRRKFFEIGEQVIGAPLGARILIDKMPLNIVNLGIANWLFPDGRAIVALRDPRDVVLSCYMQNFRLTHAMQQFLNLENAARFYVQVMELWLHYREILTIPWIEYRYEDLIDDFEGTMRRILNFVGVPWSDEVTRFQDQARRKEIRTPSYEAVTEPINRKAVARWRNYADQLAPVLPILEPFVREFGYDPD